MIQHFTVLFIEINQFSATNTYFIFNPETKLIWNKNISYLKNISVIYSPNICYTFGETDAVKKYIFYNL